MEQVADISQFEQFMNEACPQTQIKTDVAVFNNVDNIRSIVESYGFELEKFGRENGVAYRIVPSAELKEACKRLEAASKVDEDFAGKSVDLRLRSYPVMLDGTRFGGERGAAILFFTGGPTAGGNWSLVRCYDPKTYNDWGQEMANGCTVAELEQNFDKMFPDFYQTYLVEKLIPRLQEMKEQADSILSQSAQYEDKIAGICDYGMKVFDTVVEPTPASYFSSISNPLYEGD